MIKKLIIKREKMFALLNEIIAEKGEVTLFGLFFRDGDWDLFVAGPWVDEDYMGAHRYIDKKLKAHLTPEENLTIYRIVILESHYPILAAILDAVPAGKEQAVFRNEDFLGLEIKRAYVLKAKRPQKNGKMQTNKKPRQRIAPARRRLAAAH
jgi:hypothetical protein